MWEVWRQDEHGGEFLVRAFADREDAEAAKEELAARGHHQSYWVSERFAVGQYVELYPTIQSETTGESVPGGTRGIVEAVDGTRCLVAFLSGELRTGERQWVRAMDLFPG
jgi:hypothetical protein